MTVTTIIDMLGLRYCTLLFLSIVSLPVFSQNSNDTIPSTTKEQQIQVSIGIDDLNALKSENDSLKFQLAEVKAKYQKLQTESVNEREKLKKLEISVKQLTSDTTRLYSFQREADKRLVNIASNFLYIPYEAFSIEKIAIPAFKAIANADLKREHGIKYELLCNYRKDIEGLISFMDYASNELQKPFVKNASDILAKFQGQSFYVSYLRYPEWADTFLGRNIALIEKQLNNFDGNKHKIDFTAIKEELDKCMKTVETL